MLNQCECIIKITPLSNLQLKKIYMSRYMRTCAWTNIQKTIRVLFQTPDFRHQSLCYWNLNDATFVKSGIIEAWGWGLSTRAKVLPHIFRFKLFNYWTSILMCSALPLENKQKTNCPIWIDFAKLQVQQGSALLLLAGGNREALDCGTGANAMALALLLMLWHWHWW